MLINLHATRNDINTNDGRIQFVMPNIYIDESREYLIAVNVLYICFTRPCTIDCLGQLRSNLVDCSMVNPLQ